MKKKKKKSQISKGTSTSARIEAFHKREAERGHTHIVPGKRMSTSANSFAITKEQEWILDWNCVMFRRGYLIIYSRSDLNVKFKPTKVDAKDSLESFNYLRKYLNERLPPVRCIIKNLHISVIDNINFKNAIQQFAVAARQSVVKVAGRGGRIVGPARLSYDQALSKAKQMTPEEFKKYKSEYIDFLVTRQSKKYKVIPCTERLAHTTGDTTEYAFMFTIECRSGVILIVHENVNPDRSTLLFVVKLANYDKAIRAIYNFLQGAEINKRSSIRSGDINKSEVGIERYNSINHDYIYSWQRVILNYERN